MLRSLIPVAALAVALGAPSEARGPTVNLHFRVLAHTGIRLTTTLHGKYNLEGMAYVSR
jgi:hypothetical protein